MFVYVRTPLSLHAKPKDESAFSAIILIIVTHIFRDWSAVFCKSFDQCDLYFHGLIDSGKDNSRYGWNTPHYFSSI